MLWRILKAVTTLLHLQIYYALDMSVHRESKKKIVFFVTIATILLFKNNAKMANCFSIVPIQKLVLFGIHLFLETTPPQNSRKHCPARKTPIAQTRFRCWRNCRLRLQATTVAALADCQNRVANSIVLPCMNIVLGMDLKTTMHKKHRIRECDEYFWFKSAINRSVAGGRGGVITNSLASPKSPWKIEAVWNEFRS